MKEIKDIADAIDTRIKSPFFGYAVLALFAINWRALFFLVVSDTTATDRIINFDAHTSIYTLVWYPLIFGVISAIASPWIGYLFMRITSKPTNLRNFAQADVDHALLLKQKELEEIRNSILKEREQRILEQAKREEEIDSIENTELRERTRAELEAVRKMAAKQGEENLEKTMSWTEVLSLPINSESLYLYSRKKYPSLAPSEKWQNILLKDLDYTRYSTINDIDDVVDDSIAFVEHYKKQNPNFFKTSTDHITKSLGYSDPDFLEKHDFGYQTKKAISDFRKKVKQP